ncbi:MAG: mechanosensitive ion channel family protein [Coriobacteriia bacterium]|nr:mechanosensitive ion channel family protein [Coriobacteriia bacterium]MCL2745621.1 mechanosensitive ion channel family protein [Coriobacteriia bacterium]MCL2871346.1 mechanosensitive ion channel family protein [Coriobacteriia bacterium]
MQQTFATLIAQYGLAVLIFGGWLVGGLIVQQIISFFLRNAATKNQSRANQALVIAARGSIAWVGGIIGIWAAYNNILVMNARDEELVAFIVNARPILQAATIAIITFFLARVANRFISAYTARENIKVPSSSIFGNIVAALIWILGVSIAVVATGTTNSLTPLLGALGVSGIAIGLALQPTLDNLFSGIQILTSRQIEPGDFVRLESNEEGVVEDVTWRNTTIRRITGELVIVPNSNLAREQVINFSRNAEAFNLIIPTLVSYDNDIDKVITIMREIAHDLMERSHYVHKEQMPRILVTANSERGISLATILPVVAYEMRGRVTSEYLEEVQQHFKQAGITQPQIIPPE